ncbi:MAG: hypothetical protein AABW92_01570 [Nanoarchaeota archaeon]
MGIHSDYVRPDDVLVINSNHETWVAYDMFVYKANRSAITKRVKSIDEAFEQLKDKNYKAIFLGSFVDGKPMMPEDRVQKIRELTDAPIFYVIPWSSSHIYNQISALEDKISKLYVMNGNLLFSGAPDHDMVKKMGEYLH